MQLEEADSDDVVRAVTFRVGGPDNNMVRVVTLRVGGPDNNVVRVVRFQVGELGSPPRGR